MKLNKIIISAFVLLMLVQLYVPAKMILDREEVIATGEVFKFITAPIDPNDPFRGKYITLSFAEDQINMAYDEEFKRKDDVYVILTKNELGFAKIKAISNEKPNEGTAFIEAKVDYVSGSIPKVLTIEYPFERYYMNEAKAADAEITYRESARNTSKLTYALVYVKNGESVLTDVLIDGVSISDLVSSDAE